MAERQPDRIHVSMGFTRNLGNFQSLKLDIGLESDRLDTEKNADQQFQRIYDFVERKFMEEFDDLENDVKEKAKKIKDK